MGFAVKPEDGQYFWSGWFTGHSFWPLASVFMLLSAADLLATLRTISRGVVREGNPLAVAILKAYGLPGLVVYKVILVAVIVAAGWLIARKKPDTARILLWAALILMGYLAILHLAIMAGFAVSNYTR